jgi:hypothetical protein
MRIAPWLVGNTEDSEARGWRHAGPASPLSRHRAGTPSFTRSTIMPSWLRSDDWALPNRNRTDAASGSVPRERINASVISRAVIGADDRRKVSVTCRNRSPRLNQWFFRLRRRTAMRRTLKFGSRAFQSLAEAYPALAR